MNDNPVCGWCEHPAIFHGQYGCDYEIRRNYFDPRLPVTCSCTRFQEVSA